MKLDMGISSVTSCCQRLFIDPGLREIQTDSQTTAPVVASWLRRVSTSKEDRISIRSKDGHSKKIFGLYGREGPQAAVSMMYVDAARTLRPPISSIFIFSIGKQWLSDPSEMMQTEKFVHALAC